MKIIDSFLFFNELELLEIRLEELFDAVDFFVICECTKTHQNKPKPLHYLENKDKFKKFESKIIHHIFDPKESPYDWYIENEQRNEIKNANFEMKNGDVFLLSDADEIISKNAVNYIRSNKEKFNVPTTSIMQMSYGYINTVVEKPWHHKGWRGTIILPYDYFLQDNLNLWRSKKDSLNRFENSGWHFSFMGGAERIKTKIESYAHSEFNNEQHTDLKNITERINSLQDPLGRSDFELYIEEDFNKFPKSCLKFKNLFLSK
jgi:beta-1,4-mannosyl-glycoprotein beta-1,4-N-acetylglucosaminyltransferase